MKPIAEMNRAELAEHLRKENPDLAKALNLSEEETSPETPAAATPPAGMISEAELDRRLAAERAATEARLSENTETVEELAEALVAEREEQRSLAEAASTIIKKSGLPSGWQADLLRRWRYSPSGPSAAIASIEPIMEGDGVTAEDAKDALTVLKEAVEADIQHAVDLIAESGGGRRPRVRDLGGGNGGRENTAGGKPPRSSAFRDFLAESGDKFGEKPEDYEAGLSEMVREGVRD